MKKIIYIGIAIIIVIVAGYFIYQSKQPHYSFATVERGPIVQQVLSTGNVQSPTTIDLSFQNSGKLIALNASVGQKVDAGDILAKQDTTVLQAQLAQAQANVSGQTAKLSQLQTGATTQTIAVSRTALDAAQQSLANAHSGIPSVLADAYAKANDAVRTQLADFFSTPEGNNPQLTFNVSDSQLSNDIQSGRLSVNANLSTWRL
jgi:multidrug efflux pump subunit AcrA (membrane-fusion protein)